MEIGLFTAAGGTVASTTKLVQTIGYSLAGSGGETYAYSSTVDATYVAANPRTSFLASDTGGFKLAPFSKPFVTAFGARVDPSPPSATIQTENTAAVQAALRWGPCLLPPGTIWCNSAIMPWPAGGSGTVNLEGAGTKGVLGSRLRWVYDDTIKRPCIHIPEGYIDGETDELRGPNDALLPDQSAIGIPTGRQVIFKNLSISVTYGRYVTCIFLEYCSNNYFEGVEFSSTHRGVIDSATFNSVYSNCAWTGLYYLAGRTLDEIQNDWRKSYGFLGSGHYTILNGSMTGWGVGLALGGNSYSVLNTRMEVGECAMLVGGFIYFWWNSWNGKAWTLGTVPSTNGFINACATESNRQAVVVQAATGVRFANLTLTGTAGAVPPYAPMQPGRAPLTGIVTAAGVGDMNIFENVINSVSGSLLPATINQGSSEWRNSTTLRGASSIYSRGTRFAIKHVQPNFAINNLPTSLKEVASVDSQQMVKGITSFDGKNPIVLAQNVGDQNVTIATMATTKAISFPTGRGVGTAAFTTNPNAVTDANSTLNGTYWYATTQVGKRGETGASWAPYRVLQGTNLGLATISIASPGVVTRNSHGLAVDTPVVFTTTGNLPTGVTPSTAVKIDKTYYVRNLTTNTFEISLTPGGASINTTGTQSGTHTLYANPTAGLDLTYRSVVVASGKRADMAFAAAPDAYFRRIYRGSQAGEFDRYWEIPGPSTTFSDWGDVGGVTNVFASASAITGQDVPPGINGSIPTQAEYDPNYGIVVAPSWNTSWWISGKAASGFTINFGTAAPASATIDWFLFRG